MNMELRPTIGPPFVMVSTVMNSARTHCPDCNHDGVSVIDFGELLYSPRVDYFCCRACDCWWFVAKGQDGPATHVFGDRDQPSAQKKRAG